MRSTTLLAVALLAFGTAARAEPVDFDIPRQDAAAALTEFARQAGLPVLFPYDLVQQRRANRVRGRHEPEEALRRLLRGTGLSATRSAEGQITVRLSSPPREPVNGLVATLRHEESGDADGEPLHEVTVTGSRLFLDGMTTPTPVTAIYGAELQAMGPGALVDALVQLPQFLNNDTPQTQSFGTAGAAGASFMNLRGIGSSRTLTLLDGRRLVPTTRAGAVDIALLPKTLIERVEVVTGGASAAYGSDAVSGVVNLLIGHNNDGLKLRAQAGLSELGDNANHEWAASWGGALGARSHLLVAGELFRAQGIRGYAERDWFQGWAVVANPDPAGPAQITVPEVHARSYTYGGLITSGPLAGTQFLQGGVPAPFETGRYATSLTQSGGSGVDPGRDLVWILPDQMRGNGFARLDTDWGTAASFLQVMTGYSRNHYEKDPSAQWGPWEATIYDDNAFLSPPVRDGLRSAGASSFRLGRVGGEDLIGGDVTNLSRLWSTTAGFEASLPRQWHAQGYYQYGTNLGELTYRDTVRLDRIYRAFDSVVDPVSGRTVCRSTLSFPDDGCVPANPFGPGSISPEARAWVTEGSSDQVQRTRQHVAELSVQGDAARLPAGDVSVVGGLAWRRESLDNTPHRYPSSLEGQVVPPASQQGYRGLPATYVMNANIFERTAATRVRGRYSVGEAFAEARLPLLRERPLVRVLEADAAVRWAHYSGSGGVPAWKLGLDWRLVEELRLRATRSRDIRAGSLSERFDFSGVGATISDPFLPPARRTYAITALRSGNPEVDPEKADTLTFGGVYQPRFVPGLSMSADYFDIRIHDAIGTLGAQPILDGCYAGDALLCGLVLRNSSGEVRAVNNRYLNIAEARSRGIDAELSWRRRVSLLGGDEGLAVRVFANRTLEISTTTPTEGKVDRVGQTGLPGGAPRWQLNFALAYERGPAQLTVQERLISAGSYNAVLGPGQIDDNRVGGAAYTNLRLAWRFGQGAESLLLFANVVNLFDRDPPLAPAWTFAGSYHTNEGLFDAIGRRYVVGVRLRR